MRCYRLTQADFLRTALSGEGAKRAGGRWNSKGVAVAYACGSAELCVLEAMVHVHDDGFPLAWRMLAVDVPDELILPLTDIPSDWHEYPYRASVQFRGDEWALGGKSLALSVPSAIVQTASNYLINPLHAAAADLILIDITDAVDLRRLAARLGSKTSV